MDRLFKPDTVIQLLALGFLGAIVYVLAVNGNAVNEIIKSAAYGYAGGIRAIEGKAY